MLKNPSCFSIGRVKVSIAIMLSVAGFPNLIDYWNLTEPCRFSGFSDVRSRYFDLGRRTKIGRMGMGLWLATRGAGRAIHQQRDAVEVAFGNRFLKDAFSRTKRGPSGHMGDEDVGRIDPLKDVG